MFLESNIPTNITMKSEVKTKLTPIGKKQVRERAKKLRTQGLSFDRIITSPLKRALETANIMREMLNFEVEIMFIMNLNNYISGW